MREQTVDGTTRAFLAGALGFRVTCSTPALRTLVEALFVDLPEPPPGLDVRPLRLDEVNRDGIQLLELSGCGDLDPGALEPDLAFDFFVSRLTRMSLDSDPSRLHLHGAVMARQGRGVVISAAGGVGKSTLALAMALRGCDYLTDEMLALTPGEPTVEGLAKPLVVKATGRDLFDGLEEKRVAYGASTTTWWHLPASALGARPIANVEPALIAFLSRPSFGTAEGAPYTAPVHAADAVVMLVQQSMDVGRFGQEALGLLAELVSRCRLVAIEVGEPSATAALVEDLLDNAGTVDCGPPAVLAGQRSGDYRRDLRTAPSVVSVEIDGRVVVHDVATGKIASFDEAGSAVWLALAGRPPGDQVLPEPDSPGVCEFFDALGAEGFVVPVVGPTEAGIA